MYRYSVAVLFASVCILAPRNCPLLAEETEVRQAIAELLHVGWEASVKSREAADEQFERIHRLAPGRADGVYAYALTAMKQRRYPEASKQIDDLLVLDKQNVPAWKARIWLSMLTRNYRAALVEMDQLSRLLPDEQESSDPVEGERDVWRYLGRVFGYLEGPAGDAVSKAVLGDDQQKFAARLGPSSQAAFEEGRSSVLEQFSALADEMRETQARAEEQAREERERLLRDVQLRRQRIAVRSRDLAPRRDKLRSELKAQLDEFDRSERPLLEELSRLDARSAVLQRELALLYADIASLQALADRERDPRLRGHWLREIDRLHLLTVQYDADLLAAERQIATINAQRSGLQQRRRQTQADYNRQAEQVENALVELQRQERRLDLEEQKIRQPGFGVDLRRTRALAAHATAFTSYVSFPLEQEKQRLLDSLERDG